MFDLARASAPSVEHLTPVVKTERFTDPTQEMWVGVVALNDTVIEPVEYQAAGRLRANVYIDEMGFLPDAARESDGTETDADDLRSRHYVILARRNEEADEPRRYTRDEAAEVIGGAVDEIRTHGSVILPERKLIRAVGTMRAIVKRSRGDTLPVERLFPEVFENEPAPVSSLEASRFIARSEFKPQQNAIALGLIRAVVAQAVEFGNKPIFAVVEKPLKDRFTAIELPFEQISEVKELPEYNDTKNMVLKFDPEEIVASASKTPGSMLHRYFNGMEENRGLGFYQDGFLMSPVETPKED